MSAIVHRGTYSGKRWCSNYIGEWTEGRVQTPGDQELAPDEVWCKRCTEVYQFLVEEDEPLRNIRLF